MDQPSASSDRSDERIGTAEAARRLGVKRETLYAYVSRGLLASNRGSGRSGSTFSLTEVEALRRSGARVRGASTRPFRFPAVTTNITAVTENHLRYRGHDATRLARTATFEAVAQLLWTGVLRDQPIVAPARVLRETRALTGALPGTVDPLSRLRVAVCVAGAMDPLRFDISPPAVRRSATTALACMAGALRTVETGPEQGARLAEAAAAAGEVGIARRLWLALAPGRPREDLLRCLNAALVLGAQPVLADVLIGDWTLDPADVAARITPRTRAVIAVNL
ncbi:MAG: citrate/2-methylcitrate synthase, partial [Frankia sp.]